MGKRSYNFKDLTGQVFNNLVVLGYSGKNRHGQTLWEIKCFCGSIFTVVRCSLISGNTRSCGCLRRSLPNVRFKNLTGLTFGRLTVVSRESGSRRKNALWLCLCSDGNYIVAVGSDLRSGDTKSCGCLQKDKVTERNTKHGLSDTPEAAILNGIVQRCTNPNNASYVNYGGRGIVIEDLRWFHLEYFVEDMGFRPDESLSIERLDNNRGYCKENCIWADSTTQARNRRVSINLFFSGETKSLQEWTTLVGLKYATAYGRYRRGESIEKILSNVTHKNQFI